MWEKGLAYRATSPVNWCPSCATVLANEQVIETDIQRLYEVPGIGKKRVEKIQESWEKQKDIKNVMLFLLELKVRPMFSDTKVLVKWSGRN